MMHLQHLVAVASLLCGVGHAAKDNGKDFNVLELIDPLIGTANGGRAEILLTELIGVLTSGRF